MADKSNIILHDKNVKCFILKFTQPKIKTNKKNAQEIPNRSIYKLIHPILHTGRSFETFLMTCENATMREFVRNVEFKN